MSEWDPWPFAIQRGFAEIWNRSRVSRDEHPFIDWSHEGRLKLFVYGTILGSRQEREP